MFFSISLLPSFVSFLLISDGLYSLCVFGIMMCKYKITICNVQFVFFIAVMSTTSDVRGCPSGCRLSVQYDCHAWSGDKDPACVCPVIAPNSCSYCSYA